MLSNIFCAVPIGVQGHIIEIEASLEAALPQIHITGLPGTVVRESKDRIRACLNSYGDKLPSGRVTLHLSPADLPKAGSHYDLPMAIALLAAEKRINTERLKNIAALGELSLNGRIRKITNGLILLHALDKSSEINTIFLPYENRQEAQMIQSKKVRLVKHIQECIDILRLEEKIEKSPIEKQTSELQGFSGESLDNVFGQEIAKRALEICLAGGHHLLFIGSPGVGKTLLASCSPSLLPPLTVEEKIEVKKIYGSRTILDLKNGERPFRSPHHSISQAGLLGGGSKDCILPGEVSLAHTGVLFLDEVVEFRRDALEGLREPLQNGVVHHHRSMSMVSLPARFTLIAAMNPCPCGYSLSRQRNCLCTRDSVEKYRKRLSGPFLDRMDLVVVMQDNFESSSNIKPHDEYRKSIAQARERQIKREKIGSENLFQNAWLDEVSKRDRLSFRARRKVANVARTIADLENSEEVKEKHLQEAWGFKCFDPFRRLSISY